MKNKEEKLRIIKRERIELLKAIRERLANGNSDLSLNINNIFEVLKKDEISIKKFEALTKAQKIIEGLTKEILASNDPEQISNIRRKINYYINKIKKELLSRGVSEEVIEEYMTKVRFLRKNISLLIRTLKRKEKIKEIQYLLVSKEDKPRLTKLIRYENRFNNKYLNRGEEVLEPVIDMIQQEEPEVDIEEMSIDEIGALEELNKIVTEEEPKYDMPDEEVLTNSIDEYFETGINKYNRKYKTTELYEYEGNFKQRLVSLFKNIPIIIRNWKEIDKMFEEVEENKSLDLVSYAEYLKYRNSFEYHFKSLFKNTKLFSDDKYLAAHDNCVEWIKEFCNENIYELPGYEKVLTH